MEKKLIESTDKTNMLLAFILSWISLVYGISLSWFMSGAVIFLPTILICIVIVYLYIKERRKLIFPYVFFPIIFFSYMLIRHSMSEDIFHHGAVDLLLFSFALFNLIALSKKNFIEKFYFFCKTMLIISIAVAILSYMTYLIPSNISEYNLPLFLSQTLQRWHINNLTKSRFYGLELNPNTTGNWVAYGFIFGIGTYLLKPEKKHNLLLLGIDLILTLIILLDTACRSAMLFCGIAALGLIIAYFTQLRHLLQPQQRKIITTVILLSCVILIIVGILFLCNIHFRTYILNILRVDYTSSDNLLAIFSSIGKSFEDASDRANLRKTAVDIWSEHKILGVSTVELNSHFPQGIWLLSGCHNTLLQILATLGLIGLSLFLIYVLSSFIFIWISSIKSKDPQIKIISTFCIILFIAIAVNNYYENYMYTSGAIMTLCGYFLLSTGFQIRNIYRADVTN